jgi:hypothetical protein
LAGRKIFVVGNICALCEETYPRSALYICDKCGKMYCGNCILFEDGGKICLKCAVKGLFNHAPKSKYAYLSMLLTKAAKFRSKITMRFAEIEDVIGDKLPASAYKYKHWWSNIRNYAPSESWLTAGWRVEEVNLEENKVTFLREEKPSKEKPEIKGGRGSRKSTSEFKALALKAKIRRKTPISKTKMSMLQARLKNIERTRRVRRRGGRNLYERKIYSEI